MAKKSSLLAALVTSALVAAAMVAPLSAQADDGDDFSATISGNVTGAGAELDVTLYDSTNTPLEDTAPDGAGNYSFTVDTAGSYAVSFTDERTTGAYLTRFYPDTITDAPDDARVTYFAVTGDVGGINGTLSNISFADHSVSITGKALFGMTLTANTDDWVEAPDFSFQWFRGNSAIAGATDSDYDVAAADLGSRLSVEATATLDGYDTKTVESSSVSIDAATETVKAIKAVKPTVTGTAKVGKRLKAAHGTWTPGSLKFTYQWYVGKTPIAKATKSSYKITKAYKGKKIRVAVTGGKVGVGAVEKYSASTKRVKK